MQESIKKEVWLRGALPGIVPALQPVGHALLQASEEVNELMKDFPGNLLWRGPAGLAPVAFHLQHLAGVLNRLFTYARGQSLTEPQLAALAAEGKAVDLCNVQSLLQQFNQQVDASMLQLGHTSAEELFETRGVGRAQIPSTVIGLLVHAAEHTMRHTGQLLVTVKVVRTKTLP